MRRWMMMTCGAAGLVLLLAGCGGMPGGGGDIETGPEPAEGGISEVPNPTPAMAAASKTPLETLQRGHVTYMLKCGECHNYMLPKHVDVEDWEDVMPKMIRHAGLASEDEKAVLAYVLAVKAQ